MFKKILFLLLFTSLHLGALLQVSAPQATSVQKYSDKHLQLWHECTQGQTAASHKALSEISQYITLTRAETDLLKKEFEHSSYYLISKSDTRARIKKHPSLQAIMDIFDKRASKTVQIVLPKPELPISLRFIFNTTTKYSSASVKIYSKSGALELPRSFANFLKSASLPDSFFAKYGTAIKIGATALTAFFAHKKYVDRKKERYELNAQLEKLAEERKNKKAEDAALLVRQAEELKKQQADNVAAAALWEAGRPQREADQEAARKKQAEEAAEARWRETLGGKVCCEFAELLNFDPTDRTKSVSVTVGQEEIPGQPTILAMGIDKILQQESLVKFLIVPLSLLNDRDITTRALALCQHNVQVFIINDSGIEYTHENFDQYFGRGHSQLFAERLPQIIVIGTDATDRRTKSLSFFRIKPPNRFTTFPYSQEIETTTSTLAVDGIALLLKRNLIKKRPLDLFSRILHNEINVETECFLAASRDDLRSASTHPITEPDLTKVAFISRWAREHASLKRCPAKETACLPLAPNPLGSHDTIIVDCLKSTTEEVAAMLNEVASEAYSPSADRPVDDHVDGIQMEAVAGSSESGATPELPSKQTRLLILPFSKISSEQLAQHRGALLQNGWKIVVVNDTPRAIARLAGENILTFTEPLNLTNGMDPYVDKIRELCNSSLNEAEGSAPSWQLSEASLAAAMASPAAPSPQQIAKEAAQEAKLRQRHSRFMPHESAEDLANQEIKLEPWHSAPKNCALMNSIPELIKTLERLLNAQTATLIIGNPTVVDTKDRKVAYRKGCKLIVHIARTAEEADLALMQIKHPANCILNPSVPRVLIIPLSAVSEHFIASGTCLIDAEEKIKPLGPLNIYGWNVVIINDTTQPLTTENKKSLDEVLEHLWNYFIISPQLSQNAVDIISHKFKAFPDWVQSGGVVFNTSTNIAGRLQEHLETSTYPTEQELLTTFYPPSSATAPTPTASPLPPAALAASGAGAAPQYYRPDAGPIHVSPPRRASEKAGPSSTNPSESEAFVDEIAQKLMSQFFSKGSGFWSPSSEKSRGPIDYETSEQIKLIAENALFCDFTDVLSRATTPINDNNPEGRQIRLLFAWAGDVMANSELLRAHANKLNENHWQLIVLNDLDVKFTREQATKVIEACKPLRKSIILQQPVRLLSRTMPVETTKILYMCLDKGLTVDLKTEFEHERTPKASAGESVISCIKWFVMENLKNVPAFKEKFTETTVHAAASRDMNALD